MLTDGHTTFTPSLSETNALGSRFYLPDAQGNSRGLLDGGQSATDGYNWDAFGSSVSRYYDSRTGRFISQDPAEDGDNWYACAGNDPVNGADPSGLMPAPTGAEMWGMDGGSSSDGAAALNGGLGYSGSSGTPIYNAIFTAGKGTDQIVGCFITGLAGTFGGSQVNVVTYEGFTPQEANKQYAVTRSPI